MTDWRQWLEELEQRVAACSRAWDSFGRYQGSARMVKADVPKLIEGYRLLAEAVEARKEYLTLANSPYPTRSEGEALKREYEEEKLIEKMRRCHEIALAHLRGVGRD